MMDEIAEIEPLAPFRRWLDEAWKGEPNAHAMTLATATPEGRPSVRAVLLKGLDARGFVFYTNLESRKSDELFANPHAALCFLWKSLNRQVRVEGPVERVGDDEADAYFASRPRDSQLGAWASDQSRRLESRALLERLSKRGQSQDRVHAQVRIGRTDHDQVEIARSERRDDPGAGPGPLGALKKDSADRGLAAAFDEVALERHGALGRLDRRAHGIVRHRQQLGLDAKPAREVDLQFALHGGEDYELVFTVPAGKRVPSRIAGIPITQIGHVTRGSKIFLRTGGGVGYELHPLGWEHFRS